MSSKLEQFIKNNRTGFNSEIPPAGVWETIEASLPVEKKKGKVFSLRDVYKLTAAAAVFCIVLTSVYFLYIRKKEAPVTIVPVNGQNKEQLSSISPEYKSEINQAFNAIQTRQQQLKNATVDNPKLYEQFLSDIQVLDSNYRMLHKQALQTPNRDVIMKAMIQNLQLQAELLYRQLMITNDLKKEKQAADAELKG